MEKECLEFAPYFQIEQLKCLKKEYKKVTGNTLSLTKDGEADVHLEYISRVRCWVTASCSYKIGGIDEVQQVGKDSEDRVEKNFRDFLNLGGNK